VASDRGRSSPLIGLAVGALAGLTIEDLGLVSVASFWGDPGPLVVVCALACALLWTTRLRRLTGLTVAALGVLWLLVAFTPLASWLADGLVRRDPPSAADAVFVHASNIYPTGELSSTAVSRVLHGVELVAEHQAPVLLLSDLKGPYPSYVGATKALLENLGIAAEVQPVGKNLNTHEEALSLARLCNERGWKRVLVVTSPYHTRRACAAVEHEGLSVVCSPSAENNFDIKGLARTDGRRRAFAAALHERIGLFVYWWRGWLAPSAVGG